MAADRYGLNGSTTGKASLATDIVVAAQAGFRYLELRDTKIEAWLRESTLEALRDRVHALGLQVLSVNALEDATLRTGAALDAVLARGRTLCAWAAALDCPYVVAVPSFLPPDGLGEAEVRARTVAALRGLASVAAPLDVQVGFEFLGFPTCSVNTVRAARGIIDAVGDPRVGLIIDAFHFYIGSSQLEDLEGLDGSRVFIVHLDDAEAGDPTRLTDAQRLLPGEGVIPLRSLVERLEATGYRGAYSLELFRPEYWAWEPDVLARRGMEAMWRVLHEPMVQDV